MFFLLPAISCGHHKLNSDELERNKFFAEILKREDSRSLGDDQFFRENLLACRHEEVREWCALALGRIGSAQALPWLFEALKTGTVPVRSASAFAIGVIEDSEVLKERHLQPNPGTQAELMRLLDDTSLLVRMRAVEALGRIGSQSGAAEIAKRLERLSYTGSPAERAYVDYSITALMRLNHPSAFPVLAKLSEYSDPEIQWRAVRALSRSGDKRACAIFVRLLDSRSPEVRAYTAQGIGSCGDAGLAELLLPLLPPRDMHSGNPIPLPVRFCALRALGSLRNTAAIPSIKAALSADPIDNAHSDQMNFAIQAAETLGNIGSADGETTLLQLLRHTGPVANNAMIALAKIHRTNPADFWNCVDGSKLSSPDAQCAWAEAMAELGGPKAVEELERMLAPIIEQNPTQSTESIIFHQRQLIPVILASLVKTDAARSSEIFTYFLSSNDRILVRAALESYKPKPTEKAAWLPVIGAFSAMSKTGSTNSQLAALKHLEPWIHEKAVQSVLLNALNQSDRNVRLAAAGLLRKAGVANPPSDPGPSVRSITDTGYITLTSNRKERSIAIVETTRGKIEIELFREETPMAVRSFILMAKVGLYNGLKFRVSPFYTIESENPRLVHRGRLGQTTRSEINMRPYERGSVGMLTAYADSEEGQFFITLAPQPQLNGMYTCFGRVISGMQVVDRMVPGDSIKQITISEDKKTIFDFRKY